MSGNSKRTKENWTELRETIIERELKEQRASLANMATEKHDYTKALSDFVDHEALNNLSELPSQIWERTVSHFNSLDSDYFGLTKEHVVSRVYRRRRDNYGGDAISKLEAEQLGNKSSAFLRYNMAFPDKDGPQRVMMFSNPELLDLAKYSNVSV